MIIDGDRSASISRWSSTLLWYALVSSIGFLIATPALAHAESARFDIASQPLPTALKAFAAQAHMQLLYEHLVVAGATGNEVTGELDTRIALEQLLRGTGLEIIYSSENAATIRPAREHSEKNVTKEPKKSTGIPNRSEGVRPVQADQLLLFDCADGLRVRTT